jgi:NAD(P)-dependent dehydrogenase (short-subunit alcohol dehydrogenase family)
MSDRRVAMVTGASRGIGRAIAVELAAGGYDVAITARTITEGAGPDGLPGSLDTTAAEIRAHGRDALPVPLDLLDRDALVPTVETVLDAWGHIDVLVNNAIYVGPGNDDRFLDVAPEHLERRLFANLTAQLLLSQRALRSMVDCGTGTVINITSSAGVRNPSEPLGEGGWALGYGCAKGGFHRMAGVVAIELGDQGIRCYNVEPGYIATERAKAQGRLQWLVDRGNSPDVVGAAVRWLLESPDGTLANGRTLYVKDFVERGGAEAARASTA